MRHNLQCPPQESRQVSAHRHTDPVDALGNTLTAYRTPPATEKHFSTDVVDLLWPLFPLSRGHNRSVPPATSLADLEKLRQGWPWQGVGNITGWAKSARASLPCDTPWWRRPRQRSTWAGAYPKLS